MRIFKTKNFNRFVEKENLDDNALRNAIQKVENGLIDADLGGNLIKLRIARKGQGKSTGYRTIIAYKKNKKAFFLYGFAKNEQENISKDHLLSLKDLASSWIKASDEKINLAISKGILNEVIYE
ncbi:hypothetical protein BN1013_02475 [Candidatus Rubidus massiliensis]|nr:hypothetical protein BN1013_02475 [Candidatus Rubidus massiliensis]